MSNIITVLLALGGWSWILLILILIKYGNGEYVFREPNPVILNIEIPVILFVVLFLITQVVRVIRDD